MDDDSLGFATVLPVADEVSESFELDLPPANGLDYLRRVRLEAKSCPATVTVEIKELPTQSQKSFNKDSLSYRASAITSNHISQCSPAPSGYAPSIQWQRKQVAAFSKVRMKLSQEMKAIKNSKRRSPHNLPKASDVNGWCRLCFGKVDQRLITHAADTTEEPMDQSETAVSSSSVQSEKSTQTPPLLSIMSYLEQETLLAVLGYHISWFEMKGFSHLQGQWFYALLAALEKPLLPESCSLLRNLARLCSNLRASLESSTDSLLPQLNLIICLVSRYFEQSDMADDACTSTTDG